MAAARKRRAPPMIPLLLVLVVLLATTVEVAHAEASGMEEAEEEPAAVIDLDALGEATVVEDKSALLSTSEPITFPLKGEEGNFEMYKGWRDIAAAENFSAADYLSIRGAVLTLTPDDGDPTTFPMCELFAIGARLRLHCIMIGLTMRRTCKSGVCIHTCMCACVCAAYPNQDDIYVLTDHLSYSTIINRRTD